MLIVQIVKEDPPSPRKLNNGVPRDLETICLKCLAKEPQQRYESMADLRDDLDCWQIGMPIRARPIGRLQGGWRWCRRHPAVTGLLGVTPVVLALVVALLVAHYYNDQIVDSNRDLKNVAQQLDEALAVAESKKTEADTAREQALHAHEQARRYMYVAQVNLAATSIRDGDFKRAYHLLEPFRDDVDLRRFEWYHLWERCGGEAFRLQGHARTIDCLGQSQDGQLHCN